MPMGVVVIDEVQAAPLHLQTHLSIKCFKDDALKRKNAIKSVANIRSKRPGSRVSLEHPGKETRATKMMPCTRKTTPRTTTIIHLGFYQ
jgi:hypothetical protein